MYVVLNSDVLFQPRLVTTSLSARLTALLDACREHGHVVVIPETVRLEFERAQEQLAIASRRELERAYGTLAANGVTYERLEPEEVIVTRDLVDLARQAGGEIEHVEPTYEDLREAHRRACLHEAPHPPEIKSDEMRDLVIWVTALRLSRERGGVLLVSADVVHVHARGDAEALQVGLTRAESIEDALESLEVQSPAGQLIDQLLRPAWPALRNGGLPVGEDPTLTAVAQTAFVEGVDGIAAADCRIKLATESGAALTARVEIRRMGADVDRIRFWEVRVSGEPIPDVLAEVKAPVQGGDDTYNERLAALKEILGGEG